MVKNAAAQRILLLLFLITFMCFSACTSINEAFQNAEAVDKPEQKAEKQQYELSTSLIYVTNEDSNNVSVINRYSGEIAATIAVGKKPKGVAVSSGKDGMKVYVANSGSDSVSVIDATKQEVEKEIPVRFGNGPEGIAVASSISQRPLVFVTNFRSNSVSVIDPQTFKETEKIEVGNGPVAVAADPPVEDLFGSRSLSSEDINTIRSFRQRNSFVYVANYHSNTLSVITLDNQTGRSSKVVTVESGWNPLSLTVDYRKGKVYAANYNSDNITVVDILKLINGDTKGSVSTMNNLGITITGIVSESAFDRIYILREEPGDIVIVRPVADTADALKTVMPPVMGTMSAGKSPRSFIMDPENRKFYVVNRGADSVSVINKITREKEKTISVGSKPYGIAMF